ncbi:MAG: hypothetical protein QXG08_07960 [Candidatus Methanomethyliaceae archaeon]
MGGDTIAAAERSVKILRSDFSPPYNLLSLADGESVEFTVQDIKIGTAEREIVERGRRITETIKIARIFLPPGEFVFGTPYLDVIAGRLIETLQALNTGMKKPFRLKLTAHGVEPSKWYEPEVTPL